MRVDEIVADSDDYNSKSVIGTEVAVVADEASAGSDSAPKEIGGREGPDPTRYGDWEKAGRCIDF
jgi:hypothetical protein